jgi:Spy/CpxP family protein refolding chaperone
MTTKSNRNLLIWLIVILLATNISTIGTIFYHIYFQERPPLPERPGRELVIPEGHLGRFFRDEMNLTPQQHRQFRDFRQHFHYKADVLVQNMQERRNEMFDELAKENPDTVYLNQLANQIGDLHGQLKRLTYEFYLQMKGVCNPDQQRKLHFIFSEMMNDRAGMKMPNRINNHNKN